MLDDGELLLAMTEQASGLPAVLCWFRNPTGFCTTNDWRWSPAEPEFRGAMISFSMCSTLATYAKQSTQQNVDAERELERAATDNESLSVRQEVSKQKSHARQQGAIDQIERFD
ncbi:hypothetical protein ACVBEH_05155 [Roseateles sp. GG27B]